MPWLWRDDKEFSDYVRPAMLQWHLPVLITHQETWFWCHEEMHDAATKLSVANGDLIALGFGKQPMPEDHALLEKAANLTWDIAYEGERLLLFHKRLAQSEWAYDFLHEHDLSEHWVRYAATKRIFREIGKLAEAARELLQGYEKLQQEDDRFLIRELNLPEELQSDFVLSRNLFSVGFDELAVLVACRGLEGVIRQITKQRKIKLPGKADKLAFDADLNALIEAFGHLRLADGTPVLDQRVVKLLQYGRTVRNASAHPGSRPRQTARELAKVITSEAEHVWNACEQARFKRLRTKHQGLVRNDAKKHTAPSSPRSSG